MAASGSISRRRSRILNALPQQLQTLLAWKRWPQLPATRYGNFATVDANLLHRMGPRFVDGVESLCAAIDAARSRKARAN